ncbi:4-hydroxy-tetrahydrodipicolinate synthase [Poseidonocella pacifica]|uniref:4-hydroxy-tetrahydrodipicolinate synthase n=1 Tax=Poseidonocella pacifica TaxID=871651 RepID=A0A1I0WCF3_9RHOB|nr:dihydrodipicolinate synthase family protein [Poseidonocella pacifica]SFA86435.1 4-hydroxy-tetrahydrodipicolinate synthase [Poseidonocella pacifica]
MSTKGAALFRGLSAFPMTPSDEGLRLRPERLAILLERIVAAGADSVGLLGSTGSYVYLTPEERRRVLRVASEVIDGKVPLIVGVGAMGTQDAAALARDAEEGGADGVLLAPVSYQRLTSAEVHGLFADLSAATSLPICIYNNPTTTGFTFSEELIGRLAELPNVVAVKMPFPASRDVRGEIGSLRARLPEGFTIGYSGDWEASKALLAGADAWFSVIAGMLPVPAVALARAAIAEDRAEVMRLEAGFEPLWSLFREFGSFRVNYAIAPHVGLTGLAPPRPVLPLDAVHLLKVEAAIRHLDEQVGLGVALA